MQRDISQFSRGQYDVLVIGGGINGAAVAHLAALNGLKTALLEKDDFASGTSSKSTKLIHGGLRYLENLEFGLVREALKERAIQLKAAPHLVKPLAFIIPVYQEDKRPLWLMRLGVALYDLLCGSSPMERHRFLPPEEVCRHVVGIKKEGLLGGIMYYDAQMDDARLCLENVLSAGLEGAHAANYVEVQSFIKENGKAVGVKAYDRLGARHFEVSAKRIVCAAGPWTNVLMQKEEGKVAPMIRTTKGVHVVCHGQVSSRALIIPTQKDNRFFFVIPWMGNSLIGTTDTDYSGSPDEVGVDQEDVDYLFRELRRVFPDAAFKKEKIITMFSGLRPLVHRSGNPADLSRRHVIRESYSGVLYVLGGKYTTYRKIAEDCLQGIMRARPAVDTQKTFKLYGSGPVIEKASDAARQYGVPAEIVQYLMDFYGARYKDVLDLISKEKGLAEPMCSCSPAIRAQIAYAIQVEMARTEEDIYKRRLPLVFTECRTGHCRKEIQRMVSKIRTL